MSELIRIESIYGSVAEYNRVQQERDEAEYWDSLSEEQKEQELKEYDERRNNYYQEVDALNIEPSEMAKELKESFDKIVNNTTGSYYDRQENYTKAFKESMQKIVDAYGQKISDNYSIYNGLDNNKFGIDYSYSEYGPVTHKNILNLDKDTFLQMYADMYSIGGYKVKPSYRDSKSNLHTVSGLSVGELRRNEFRRWGVDDPDGKAILDDLAKKRAEQASNIISNDKEVTDEYGFIN